MLSKRLILLSFFICTALNCFCTDPITISESVDMKTQRTYQNLSYMPQNVPIFFCLSFPAKIPKEGLTCIIVMAGLAQGQKNLEFIEEPRNYAFIGYEYPLLLQEKHRSIFDLYKIRKQTIHVPFDILDIASWVLKQTWSNQIVSVAGFSFGAMFVPAIYHEAEKQDIPLAPGVIAYAGADLYPILKINLPGNKFTKPLKASIAAFLLKSLEPSKHLPYLHNDFLIINGKYDDYIPFEQAQKLQELTPKPKTIINLETSHLSPANKSQLREINRICDRWFEDKLH